MGTLTLRQKEGYPQWLDMTFLHYIFSLSEHRGMTWLNYIIDTSRNKHRGTRHKIHRWIHSEVTNTSIEPFYGEELKDTRNGLSSIGKLYANQRNPGARTQAPGQHKQIPGGKNLVEMDFPLRGTMGEVMASEICTTMVELTSHQIRGRSTRFKHMEVCPRK